MTERQSSRGDLQREIAELKEKLREAEETIEAIRSGSVDALIISNEHGDQAYTLEGSDHAYRILVESMKEGAVTVAEDGTIFYCNARFAEMLAVPSETIIGHSVFDFISGPDQDTFKVLFKHGLKSSSRGEVAVLRPEQASVPVYLSMNSLKIYAVPAVCMVVTDLTEQRRSEEIIAAEKLARSILNQAAEAIVVADENGRIIRASQTAEEMAGESLGLKVFNDIFRLHNAAGHEVRFAAQEGDLPRFDIQSDLLKLAMQGQIAQGIEVTLDRGDGRQLNLLLSAGPVLNQDNRVLGCTVTLTDITERKRVEEELKKAKDEAYAAKEAADLANRAKSTFLANMSHEIRTPLGAVLGFAELMASPEMSNEQREDFVAKVKRNGQMLSSLIDDILDLSKVESGRLQIDSIEFSLRELLYDVISALKYRLMEKAIALNIRTVGPVPRTIKSDPVRLKQVLTNIIGNAVKFTEKGAVSVTVTLSRDGVPARHGGHLLRIAVEDTGCGLKASQVSNLFEAFKQADGSTTRKYGGTGLGLALSRGLARAMGGDVVLAKSVYGQGSTFVISIAPEECQSEDLFIRSLSDLETNAGDAYRAVEPEVRIDGLRVLLVEDAPDNQFLVGRLLRKAGAIVELADNGLDAVTLATKDAFDVILMDIQMPLLDGIEATRRLRTQGCLTPIVALTAHAMKEERDRCLSVGCDGHLTKPVNRHALLSQIRRLTAARVKH